MTTLKEKLEIYKQSIAYLDRILEEEVKPTFTADQVRCLNNGRYVVQAKSGKTYTFNKSRKLVKVNSVLGSEKIIYKKVALGV